ncbi:MAG TPA: PEP-CTERM sorting domain-containing protein [Opitutaceae bacterium]|nr:PEP-CTERM sorting domain-containing protein [Opitutaceae bacterium]
MKTRTLFALVVVGCVMALVGRAQTVIYTWIGFGQYPDTSYSYNWQNGTLPLNDVVNTQLVFGDARNTVVHYYDLYANKITVSGNTRSYDLVGDYDTTHLGDGGIVYAPSGAVTSTLHGRVMLEANQTWNIQGGTFAIADEIKENTGPFTITKTGAGTLDLQNPYSIWTGGINLNAGTVAIHALYDETSTVFGTGTVTFNGGTLMTLHDSYDTGADYVEIENDIVSNGLLRFVNKVDLYLSSNGSTSLTLNDDTTIETHGRPTWIETPIVEASEGTSLTFSGPGWTVIDAPSEYTGSTVVNNGVLIFTTQGTLPTNPVSNAFTVSANGYLGFGDDNTEMYTLQTTFIDRFNKAATLGTIGLDTDPGSSYPTTWTDTIDLTGFGSTARLGSATKASLAGTITPQGTDYRFGGGGGWLEITSALTGARNVVVDSPTGYPLTVRLGGANTYSGTTTVTNSGVVFGDTSQPTGTHTVTINAGGYVGTESANSGDDTPDDSDIAAFLNTITTSSTGMIGFDGTPSGGRYLSRPINLSGFTGSLYLGTATTGYTDYGIQPGLILNGTITTTNGGTDPYRFAGYKGGLLQVDSSLSGSQGVIIGDPNSPATFGDYFKEIYSTVYLRGDNSTLTGNVTLYAGELFVGQQNGEEGYDPTSALGTGTLVVQGMTLPTAWTETGNKLFPLLSTSSDIIIANQVQLNTTLGIGSTSESVIFTGKISGTGGLYLNDPYYNSSTILSNDANDFSGGVYVEGYASLYVETNHSLGTGRLAFGNSSGDVYFDSTAPVVYGLETTSDEDYPSLYVTQPNTVLTVNQSFDSNFQGDFYSEAVPDNFRIVKTGSGTLNLAEVGFYPLNGTVEATLPGSPQVMVQVNSGKLVFTDVWFSSNAPTIWVHGGMLAFDHFNSTYSNPVVVDNSGRLSGVGGSFGSVTVSSTGILSPGVAGPSDVGALHFSNMTLMAGGVLEWNLRNPDQGGGDGFDIVTVSTQLTVDASVAPGTPFTLKLISLGASGNPGTAVGFLNQPYTWTLFSASSLVFGGGSFNPAAFTIDSSSFTTDVGPGTFALSQSGSMLQLTFTPVPEPSTYALLATGLGVLGWVVRRRRA